MRHIEYIECTKEQAHAKAKEWAEQGRKGIEVGYERGCVLAGDVVMGPSWYVQADR